MKFNAPFAPIERTLSMDFRGRAENFAKLGVGTYVGKSEISFFAENPIAPHILIGHFCSLAGKIYFNIGGNHNYKNVSSFPFDVFTIILEDRSIVPPLPYIRPNRFQVIIGHDVWIGHGATIMGGVKIGNGAVIGAKAVVAKDIPPYAIAVGNPARVIKYRFDAETVKKFLAVKWWNWDAKKIADNLPLMTDVEKFLATHYSPALEDFPEDKFAQRLNRFGGKYVYQFIADFRAPQPLWQKVIAEFMHSNLNGAVLVVWLGKEFTPEDFNALKNFTTPFFEQPTSLRFFAFPPTNGKNFSPRALRRATHFIATREMSTLEATDYLWDTQVKIISALDENIFAGAH